MDGGRVERYQSPEIPKDWNIRETIHLKGCEGSYVHISMAKEDFERAFFDLCRSLGIGRERTRTLLRQNSIQVRFGDAEGPLREELKRKDFLGAQARTLFSKLAGEKTYGSVSRQEDGAVQLTIDIKKLNEDLPEILRLFSKLDYMDLPNEVKIRAFQTILKKFFFHEIVHAIQELRRPEDVAETVKAILFTCKARAAAMMGAVGSVTAAVMRDNLFNLLYAGLSFGAFTLLHNRMSKKLRWIGEEACEVQDRIGKMDIKDPFRYNIEHYLPKSSN